jgi:branched-chain amino acid transport system substrate-binding protein
VTFDDHNQAILPMALVEIVDAKPVIKGMITTRVDYGASAK